MSLATALRTEVQAHLGAIGACSKIEGSSQAQVWRVETTSGVVAIKAWRDHASADRERRALRAFEAAGLAHCPRIRVDMAGPPPAIAMTWLPGRPVSALSPDAPELPAVHRLAGSFRRAMGDVPSPADSVPLAEALALRVDAWLRRGDALVGTDLTTRVGLELAPARLEEVVAVSGRRVWCHRDYESRNWLVDGSGPNLQLHVLDFGQARPDLELWDLVKLAEGAWIGRPDLRHAFFAGYARRLREPEEAALLRLGLFHGYQTLVWGKEHADAGFEALGERILLRRLTS